MGTLGARGKRLESRGNRGGLVSEMSLYRDVETEPLKSSTCSRSLESGGASAGGLLKSVMLVLGS